MAVLSLEAAAPDLRRTYREGRLIPFIGAGFSMPLRLPSWGELIRVLGEQLGFEPELFELHGAYEQLAGYFERMKAPDARDWLVKWMRTQFHRDEAEQLRKRSVQHRALAAHDWRTIYTTNYDQHLERAIIDAGKPVVSLARLDDFMRPSPAGACQIIKFHGDIDAPETLVLTEEAYFHRLSLESACDQRLRADMLANSFLFVGYSFRDVNIRYIWYRMDRMRDAYRKEVQRSEPPRRCWMATFGAGHVQPVLLDPWNIDVIELDPKEPSRSVARLFDVLHG